MCRRTQRSDHRRVFIQQEPYCDFIHCIDVAPGAIVEVCGEPLDALLASLVVVCHTCGCRSLVRTRLTEDSSELREPLRGIIHRA